MTQAVDLQPLVYAMSADIRGLRRDLAKAKGETDKTVREIDARMKKPVSGEIMRDVKREVMASTTLTQKFGGAMAALGPTALAAGVGIGAAAAAVAQFNAAMVMAAELDDAAQALQMNVEALQEYRYALVKAGGPAKDADEAIGAFTSKLGQAELGVKRALSWFEKLGFSQKDLQSFADADQAMAEVMRRIGQLSSASERAAIAEKLGLEKMIPVINRGGDALAGFREEARKVGYVMSEEVVTKLGDAEERAEVLGQVIRVNLAGAFADLSPVIISTLGVIQDVTGAIGPLIERIQSFQGVTSDLFMRLPKWMQDVNRFGLNRMVGGREYLRNVYGVDPDTGLPLKDRNPRQDFGANADRNETIVDANTWTPPKRAAGGGETAKAKRARSSGPTPEELARRREELQLEVALERAKASGDATRIRQAETEQWLRQRTAQYVASGVAQQAAEQQAIRDRLALNEEEIRQAERLADLRAAMVDLSLDPSVLEPYNAAFLEMAEEHEARYREVFAGAVDAFKARGLDGIIEYFATRLGDRALEELSAAFASAAMQAEASAASSSGGFNWGSVLKLFAGFFANPGSMQPGQWGVAGEAGPEVFRAKPGGGVEFMGANRVRSLSMPAMPAVASRGGGDVYQTIYADQSILTPDVFRAIGDMGRRSAMAGAAGGAAMAEQRIPVQQARRARGRIPR